MQRPSKPVFTVYVNEGFTTPVEPSLPELDDDDTILDVDWDDELSYSSMCRDYFAPMSDTEIFS